MTTQNLNESAYALIDQLTLECERIVSRFQEVRDRAEIAENMVIQLQQENDTAFQEMHHLKAQQQSKNQALEDAKSQIDAYTKQHAYPDIVPDTQKQTELEQKISELETQNKALEEKYQTTYALLQKEMVKVDTIQMALELAQRERDVALRKQSLTPEQKKLLVKLEHENYKINEAIERIDYISETLGKIIAPNTETVSS